MGLEDISLRVEQAYELAGRIENSSKSSFALLKPAGRPDEGIR
jgi:hypothetical protein